MSKLKRIAGAGIMFLGVPASLSSGFAGFTIAASAVSPFVGGVVGGAAIVGVFAGSVGLRKAVDRNWSFRRSVAENASGIAMSFDMRAGGSAAGGGFAAAIVGVVTGFAVRRIGEMAKRSAQAAGKMPADEVPIDPPADTPVMQAIAPAKKDAAPQTSGYDVSRSETRNPAYDIIRENVSVAKRDPAPAGARPADLDNNFGLY